MSETASNGRFFDPENLQNHLTKEKERRKRKREEKKRRRREKSNGCTLSFYNSYFGDFGRKKKLLKAKGPFDNNVFKNSARYKKEDKKRFTTLSPSPSPPPPQHTQTDVNGRNSFLNKFIQQSSHKQCSVMLPTGQISQFQDGSDKVLDLYPLSGSIYHWA